MTNSQNLAMRCRPLFAAIFCLSLTSLVSAQEEVPRIFPKSNDGQAALAGFRVPDGFKVQLFADEPQMANPVAFGIDEQGRVFVCESFRQNKGVEDNRKHMVWLETDLQSQSVDDRLAMYQKFLPDMSVMTTQPDRLRLLTDTDGDGRADRSTLFSENFHGPLDGTGAGVLAHRGNVYYTCIPELYVFRDNDNNGVADVKSVVHHGFGVRVAFSGHDMHGLTLGPDGRLYFSIGDRGFNVVNKEGVRLHMPDRGAVFRCELDGSKLEIFASGLRNPQELAFDDYGNLFTGDNNSDGIDEARWVYVVEGGETGWRMYYQYLSDRGVWNRERLWYPFRADAQTTAVQPAYIIPPVDWIADGPSGLTRYPGVGLDDRYQGHFFLADFRGSPANSGVRSLSTRPDGASFRLVDDGWLLQNCLVTDVDFGYDGKVYVSDWVNGWPGEGKGRIYSIHDPKHVSDPLVADVTSLMKNGFEALDNARLVSLLSHADQRIRLRAQYTLAERGAVTELNRALSPTSPRLARVHATWALGQVLRKGAIDGIAQQVQALLSDADEEIRVQAARIVGDAAMASARSALLKMVTGGTPREQSLSAIALSKLPPDAATFTALTKLLQTNDNNSPVIRHAAVMGLVGAGGADQIAGLSTNESPAVRLAAVVALRRLRSPLVAKFLSDADVRVVTEAARAIHDLGIEPAAPALAALPLGSDLPEPLARRILGANFRLGGKANAEAIAAAASNSQLSDVIRLNAITLLSTWDAPSNFDSVTNELRPVVRSAPQQADEVVRTRLPGMLNGSSEVLSAVIKLAGTYKVTQLQERMIEMLRNPESPPAVRREAFAGLMGMGASQSAELIAATLNDSDSKLRAAALTALTEKDFPNALPKLKVALWGGSVVEAQRAAQLLGTVRRDAADALLAEAVDAVQQGVLSPEVHLDVLEAAASRPRDIIVSKLEKILAAQPQNDPLASWRPSLVGGDADLGKSIFLTNATASCRRCHKVQGQGGDVGPDLSGVAKANTREFLLESLVNPNAKIAKGFETVVYALDSGVIVSGIVRQETPESVTIVQPTGEVRSIPKSSIEQQTKGKSGMPEDLPKQLTKRQIRDLVEFLSTLQTPATAPPAGHP